MDNIRYNLSRIASDQVSVFERRLAHIDEVARRLATTFSDSDILSENDLLRSEYSGFVSECFPVGGDACIPPDVPTVNASRVRACVGDSAVNSAISVCSAIADMRRQMGSPITLSSFFGDVDGYGGGARIAYLRNVYSDAAFRIFSTVVKDASVSYASDFSGVCEEVYYGRCAYCILPAETSDEGILSGFRRLSAKYELSPVMSCSVSTGDSQTTGFVLFSKRIELLSLPTACNASEVRRIFSFRLDAPDVVDTVKTVRAAEAYGLRLLKIDSSPVPWDDGRYSLDISVEWGDGDMIAFLLYLTLEIPEYTPIGIYTQIRPIGEI